MTDTGDTDSVRSVRGEVIRAEGRVQDVGEFWLISAPGKQTCQDTWDALNRATNKQRGLTTNFKFNIPELKVGTLDSLVGLSEDLGKLDTYVEGVARKMAQYLGDVLENEKDKVKENLLVNGTTLAHYVTHFQWDMAKYPVKQTLRNITDIISRQVTQTDTDMKSKSQAFNNIRSNLQNLERKAIGSLMTRGLHDIVSKDDVVEDSEYLVTLVVVVPSILQKDWWAKYEKLSDMVVPQSSKKLTEDSEAALFTVTIFRKVVDEYKIHCRENKFIVRDFMYNEAEVEASRKEIARLAAEKKAHFGPLVRWIKVNFAEVFVAWIHCKALRIFVESVLRYGLPVNFQAMVLTPQKKLQKKLGDLLDHHYAYLDKSMSKTLKGQKGDITELPGVTLSSSDCHPFVWVKIGVDLAD